MCTREECVKKNIRKWKLEIPIKKLKPITSGTTSYVYISKQVRPEKTLVEPLSSSYGIDNYGHRTGRNRHKGHKRL